MESPPKDEWYDGDLAMACDIIERVARSKEDTATDLAASMIIELLNRLDLHLAEERL